MLDIPKEPTVKQVNQSTAYLFGGCSLWIMDSLQSIFLPFNFIKEPVSQSHGILLPLGFTLAPIVPCLLDLLQRPRQPGIGFRGFVKSETLSVKKSPTVRQWEKKYAHLLPWQLRNKAL